MVQELDQPTVDSESGEERGYRFMSLLGAYWSWTVERKVRNHLSRPLGFRAERYSMVEEKSRRVLGWVLLPCAGLRCRYFLLQSWDLLPSEVGMSQVRTLAPCLACEKDKVQGEGEGEGPRWGPGVRIKSQSCPAKAKEA